MNQTAQLMFKPNGICVGLYTEMIDLSRIGRMRIARATSIMFNNDKQVWRVKDMEGFPLFAASSRQKCLNWEQQYLNKKMERGLYERTHKQSKDQKFHSGVRRKNTGA